MTIFSSATGWAVESANDWPLNSGIKSVLRCIDFSWCPELTRFFVFNLAGASSVFRTVMLIGIELDVLLDDRLSNWRASNTGLFRLANNSRASVTGALTGADRRCRRSSPLAGWPSRCSALTRGAPVFLDARFIALVGGGGGGGISGKKNKSNEQRVSPREYIELLKWVKNRRL